MTYASLTVTASTAAGIVSTLGFHSIALVISCLIALANAIILAVHVKGK